MQAEAMVVTVFAIAVAAAAEMTARASGPLARAVRPADRLIEGPPVIVAAIAHIAVDIVMTDMVDIAMGIETVIAIVTGSAVDIVIITGTTGAITTAITMADISITIGLTGRGSRRLHSAS